jgi:uncharacterized protein
MKAKLIEEARERMSIEDRSHDINHALRVLKNAEYIASIEGGNLDVIVPAALFHDLIVYPKNSPKSKDSALDSAVLAGEILKRYGINFEIIQEVQRAIEEHSFSNGLKPGTLESQILWDADKLEFTGAIIIARTFCSTGQMGRPFYHEDDPFCLERKPDVNAYALDLFPGELLVAGQKMFTATARRMAEDRTKFLYAFLEQLKRELGL